MYPNDRVLLKEQEPQLTLLSEDEGVLHVGCEGEVSLPEVRPGHDPLVKLLGPGVFARTVLINLEKATFLDTSGVSWLVDCHQKFLDAGGVLVLHSLPPLVGYVLKLLHLEQVLHVTADVAAARAFAEGARR
jgi:anti-anti-sigma factor